MDIQIRKAVSSRKTLHRGRWIEIPVVRWEVWSGDKYYSCYGLKRQATRHANYLKTLVTP